jgi:hypothetical protein
MPLGCLALDIDIASRLGGYALFIFHNAHFAHFCKAFVSKRFFLFYNTTNVCQRLCFARAITAGKPV